MTKYRKHNIKLSQEVVDHFALLTLDRDRNAYMKALRERGWTLESVAECADISRERVRQITTGIPMSEAFRVAAAGYPIPEPPRYEEKAPASDKYIEPTPETLTRLLELQPFAQQVRSYGSRYRKEAEEYTWLVNYAHTVEGVTLYRLAKRLGVTHGALRFRLARYGYKKPVNAVSGAYTPILEENRVHIDMTNMPGTPEKKQEENDTV
jgi:transcriptional regulator with XRE-family HTH domain